MRNYLNFVLFCLSLVPEFKAASNTCDDHDKSVEVSLYLQKCCPFNNRGKNFIISDEALKLIFCPSEPPSSCSTDSFSYYKCSDVLTKCPSATSGYYNIELTNGSTISVYCDMEGVNCDREGGWMRVAYLNMSDPADECPPGFRMYGENDTRACGKQSGPGCQAVTFLSYNISYSQVCGRVTGYQQGSPDALHTYNIINDISREYVDGVSITRGNPRKHVWTFMASLHENFFGGAGGREECPCAPETEFTPVPQSFVGNDYFCESGNPGGLDLTTFQSADPLWDGKQCGLVEEACCNVTGIPWFHKVFQQHTTDYIELRICCDQGLNDEDVAVGFYEIYVK